MRRKKKRQKWSTRLPPFWFAPKYFLQVNRKRVSKFAAKNAFRSIILVITLTSCPKDTFRGSFDENRHFFSTFFASKQQEQKPSVLSAMPTNSFDCPFVAHGGAAVAAGTPSTRGVVRFCDLPPSVGFQSKSNSRILLKKISPKLTCSLLIGAYVRNTNECWHWFCIFKLFIEVNASI